MKAISYMWLISISLLMIHFISFSLSLKAQTSAQNYMLTRKYIQSSGSSYIEDVSYLDGFEREKQRIQCRAALGGSGDLVIPIHYGVFGRTERTYLPYARMNNNGAYDPNSFAATNWTMYGSDDQLYAFRQTDYDNSPLNRVIKQAGPGKLWGGSGKGVTTTHGFNIANQVICWTVGTNGLPQKKGYYGANTLQCIKTMDEDSCVSEIYTDYSERILLNVQLKGNERLETYYIYDDFERLCYVLPPEASAVSLLTNDILDKYAYFYQYDRWGHQIEKRLPGCDPIYYVYDKKDRLVMSQDGNQRSENAKKWSYTLYDKENRVIETGEVILTAVITNIFLRTEALMSADYLPVGVRTALQYTVYDDYDTTSYVSPLLFVPISGYSMDNHSLVKGLATSVKTRIIGTDIWLTNTIYYDERCRVIQKVSNNIQGGISRLDVNYDFVGNVVKQRESHQVGNTMNILESENVYDNRSKLLVSTSRLNNGIPATINYTYDAVGHLVSKTYGTLKETMSYNVRGWLTSKESALFKMKLRYESPQGGGIACYNGSISEWEWQQGTSPVVMYSFTYDALKRLIETVQKQKTGTSWGILSDNYLEKGITYDRNGNIKTLQRTTRGELVDNLVYTYAGNQLVGLTENIRTTSINDIYNPGDVVYGTYAYDGNGNMITDGRQALNFSYNVLNLLNEVKTGTSVKVRYTYLADGTKVRVRDGYGNNGFDYLGSLTYRQDSAGLHLESATLDDGAIYMTSVGNNHQEINYFLKDHLGSVRVIVASDGTVKERNDYYPLGARHVRSDYPHNNNRLLYNGKEEQTTGNLNYLDYGWRMYDKNLGRWFGVDKMSEKYFASSPYCYALNNTISNIDFNGLWSETLKGYTTKDKDEMSRFLNYLKIAQGDKVKLGPAQMSDFVTQEMSGGYKGKLTNRSYLLSELVVKGSVDRWKGNERNYDKMKFEIAFSWYETWNDIYNSGPKFFSSDGRLLFDTQIMGMPTRVFVFNPKSESLNFEAILNHYRERADSRGFLTRMQGLCDEYNFSANADSYASGQKKVSSGTHLFHALHLAGEGFMLGYNKAPYFQNPKMNQGMVFHYESINTAKDLALKTYMVHIFESWW